MLGSAGKVRDLLVPLTVLLAGVVPPVVDVGDLAPSVDLGGLAPLVVAGELVPVGRAKSFWLHLNSTPVSDETIAVEAKRRAHVVLNAWEGDLLRKLKLKAAQQG